jgi:hypothetical protein
MAEIIQIFCVVRRLLAPDSFPWPLLILPTNLQTLKERYKFSDVGQQPALAEGTQGGVVANAGEFVHSGSLIPIQQLLIGPNLIQIQAGADDKTSDLFYADLLKWFREIQQSGSETKEYAKSFQSIVVARLAVDFAEMLSPKLRKFLKEKVDPALKVRDAEVEMLLQGLSWRVSYTAKNPDYMYIPKIFTLEPRSGSKLSDRLYYTASPTDYATHIKLLNEFENAFKE